MSTVAFDDLGTGPPIVFVHGFCSTRRVFGYQLLGLGMDRRVLALDLPGFGRSFWDPRQAWFDQAVEAVVALVEVNRLRAPLLVGWSLGASVATAAAGRLEDARTLLVGADLSAAEAATREMVLRSIARDFPRYVGVLVRQFCWKAGPDTERWLLDMALQAPIEVAMSAVLSQPSLAPVRLAGVVVGRHDRLVPPDGARWDSAEVTIFERSGHAPFLDEKDRFGTVVREISGPSG